eukprot:90109_1
MRLVEFVLRQATRLVLLWLALLRLPMHSLGFSVFLSGGGILRTVTVVDLWRDGKCAFNTRRKNAFIDFKMSGKINHLRNRIKSVNNTKKITEAMRLVSAAKVRRAQDMVVKTRPFTEKLHTIFDALISQLGVEDIWLPLLDVRKVEKVLLVGISGDRGLCGGYNSYVIRKTEARAKELMEKGVKVEIMTIGKKITQYFNQRRNVYSLYSTFDCPHEPQANQAQHISSELLNMFINKETDAVEFIYTSFKSLISSEPRFRTVLPLSLTDISNENDELFSLTTKSGDFAVKREVVPKPEVEKISEELVFEQDPLQLLNALLPLYLDGQILHMLQESVASELSSRMRAMQGASSNASDLSKRFNKIYNRERQAGITQELSEIVAGSST